MGAWANSPLGRFVILRSPLFRPHQMRVHLVYDLIANDTGRSCRRVLWLLSDAASYNDRDDPRDRRGTVASASVLCRWNYHEAKSCVWRSMTSASSIEPTQEVPVLRRPVANVIPRAFLMISRSLLVMRSSIRRNSVQDGYIISTR